MTYLMTEGTSLEYVLSLMKLGETSRDIAGYLISITSLKY